ncbi:hypothetical protein [Brotaphodocola sp.]|uniref:hypothetical protein n=1 Tax=Brotaphodocola sp. TaxID=3073577 RepID=UPI003D7E11BD
MVAELQKTQENIRKYKKTQENEEKQGGKIWLPVLRSLKTKIQAFCQAFAGRREKSCTLLVWI